MGGRKHIGIAMRGVRRRVRGGAPVVEEKVSKTRKTVRPTRRARG